MLITFSGYYLCILNNNKTFNCFASMNGDGTHYLGWIFSLFPSSVRNKNIENLNNITIYRNIWTAGHFGLWEVFNSSSV